MRPTPSGGHDFHAPPLPEIRQLLTEWSFRSGSVDRPTIVTMANNAWRVLTALCLSLVLGLARAQDTESSPSADPPDRAARLSYIQGDVSLQPAGEQDWAAAIVNRPLTTGDKLWTEQN